MKFFTKSILIFQFCILNEWITKFWRFFIRGFRLWTNQIDLYQFIIISFVIENLGFYLLTIFWLHKKTIRQTKNLLNSLIQTKNIKNWLLRVLKRTIFSYLRDDLKNHEVISILHFIDLKRIGFRKIMNRTATLPY